MIATRATLLAPLPRAICARRLMKPLRAYCWNNAHKGSDINRVRQGDANTVCYTIPRKFTATAAAVVTRAGGTQLRSCPAKSMSRSVRLARYAKTPEAKRKKHRIASINSSPTKAKTTFSNYTSVTMEEYPQKSLRFAPVRIGFLFSDRLTSPSSLDYLTFPVSTDNKIGHKVQRSAYSSPL